MALIKQFPVWSSTIGDVLLGSAQAGAIGASFGNGAAQFGQNTANTLQMGDDGNINVQIISAGSNPAATAADKVLATYALPANALDIAFRGLSISAGGSLVSNTNTKTLKIILGATTPTVGQTVSGGTTVATGTFTTTTAAGGWNLTANLFKYGAAGSNTQIAIHETAQSGSVVSSLTAPSLTTLTESGAINITVTGNAATTATDIVFNFLQIFAMN